MKDETMVSVYYSKEEYYCLRAGTKTKPKTEPKVNTKDLIKTTHHQT